MKTSNQEYNKSVITKYRLDNVILESFFKNSSNQNMSKAVFPLRIDNRQYCSPTDYQGDKPSCCGYSTAQILESLNWRRNGVLKQFDADQIYAKAKDTDKNIASGGTYPDLAMQKGLELCQELGKIYEVKSSTSDDINELKRVIHRDMFASVNMVVTKDIYDVNGQNMIYKGDGTKAGGHSLVCCGYDDKTQMLILQNHWGTNWGVMGFFLCPYDVWKKQNNIFCWYQEKMVNS